jgi:peptide subunit release factor 1 (eRF1)
MQEVSALPALLKELRAAAPPRGKVLSSYLDTSSARTFGQAYLLTFRDLCKTLRARLPAGERELFESAAAQTERFLVDDFVPHHPGLATFASGGPGYFYVAPLPRRPTEQVLWNDLPLLEPLQAILDEYERTAVVLFDGKQARLFTIYLGEIEEHLIIDGEVPRKQRTGGWAALAQSRYARHREDHLLRHAKHTASALLTMLRAHPFDRLLMGGPDETLAVLRHQLPPPLRRRVAGSLHLEPFASHDQILRAALDTLQTTERQSEIAMVDELFEAETTAHAVLGFDATLPAVSDGRVHVLLIADSFASTGGECPSCGRLVAGPGPCPACGHATESLANLGDRIVQRVLALGARVEEVSGDAARRLLTRDGIGAWTRY